MATSLTFTKNGGKEECVLTVTSPCVVQIERDSNNDFTVYANVDGMSPQGIYSSYNKDLIFTIDVPAGVAIKMSSWSHVVSAKYEAIEA